MTVGAISSLRYSTNYNYDTTTQFKYFSMAVSDERLQELMRRYGIIQTGDSKNDIDALYQAIYPNAVADATAAAKALQSPQQSQAVQQPPQTAETTGAMAYLPWGNLMAQVGLIPTGSFDTDVEAFTNKLSQMQISATTPDQKANIGLLQAEAAIVFVQPAEPTKVAAATGAVQAQAQPAARTTGADIQAQLNKLYMTF